MAEKPAEARKEWVSSFGGAKLRCSNCRKEITKNAKSCPYCKALLSEKETTTARHGLVPLPGEMSKAHQADLTREKPGLPWFSMGLAGLLILAFFLQSIPGFTLFFLLVPSYLASEPWTLFTNIFLHGDIVHIFFNLIGLLVFGVALEKVTRKSFMALVFVASGIIGSIGAVLLTSDPSTGFLGASGGIFGFIGAVMILRPDMLINFRGIPVPMKYVGPVYMLIELASFSSADNIAHSAHVFGMFGGIVLGLWWQRGGSRMNSRTFAALCVLAVFASFTVAIPLGMIQPEGHAFEEKLGSAIAAGDTTFCRNFYEIGSSGQSNCFMLIAIAKSNPDICMELEGDLASFCFTNVALANGNKEACLQDALFEPCMTLLDPEFQCGGSLDCEILKSRTPSRCDELDEDASSLCRLFMGIADKNSEACAGSDFCNLYVGVSSADQTACRSIVDASLKRVCMAAVDRMGGGG